MEEYVPQLFDLTEYTVQSRPRLLKDYPEHAQGIASVMAEWTSLEVELVRGFTFCLYGLHGENHTLGKVVRTAWNNLESIRHRLDLLKDIAGQRLPPELSERFAGQIEPKIRARARERNRVAHAHWHVCDKLPKHIIAYQDDPAERFCYTVKDFEEITQRLIDTSNFAGSFFHMTQEITKPEIFRKLERELQERLSRDGFPTPQDKNPA